MNPRLRSVALWAVLICCLRSGAAWAGVSSCNSAQTLVPEVQETNQGTALSPSLVWNGSQHGLAFRSERFGNWEILFALLDEEGVKIGDDVRVTNDIADSTTPALVWDGTGYGVAWSDSRNGGYEIYFARLTSSGAKIGDDLRITSDPPDAPAESMVPSLVWTGTEYGLAWRDVRDANTEIYFARIDAAGAKIGADVRLTSDAASSSKPSLVWTGSQYGLAWEETRDGNTEIYFMRLDASGAKLTADLRITNQTATSQQPSLAWDGTAFGVTWQDNRTNNRLEIYFTRFDGSGNKLTVVHLCEGGALPPTQAGAVCSAGGAPLGTPPAGSCASAALPAPPASCEPANQCVGGPKAGTLCTIDRNCESPWGTCTSNFFCVGGPTPGEPCVVEDDDCGVGATCEDFPECVGGLQAGSPCAGEEDCASHDATCSGPPTIDDRRVTNAASFSVRPAMIWNGFEYGVAFYSLRSSNFDIFFNHLDTSGTKLEAADVRVTTNGQQQLSPSLDWTGFEYRTAWTDSRTTPSSIFFGGVGCNCTSNLDSDAFTNCNDCDDTDSAVFPGAPEICDAQPNNCNIPGDGGETTDLDGDAAFDACDACVDVDGDGRGVAHVPPFVANTCLLDNCPEAFDPTFLDTDGDSQGDACDPDDDNDGILDDDGDAFCQGGSEPNTACVEHADCNGGGICVPEPYDPCQPGETVGCDDICQLHPNPGQGAADSDADGHLDDCDNCPSVYNLDQTSDTDGDGVGNPCDNCVFVANPPLAPGAPQADEDLDLRGDACDNCVDDPNTNQANSDGDSVGNVCDNCPNTATGVCQGGSAPNTACVVNADCAGGGTCVADQTDADSDGPGDVCDNCPDDSNPLQDDTDGDLIGDACDCCVTAANSAQSDFDADSQGDACDTNDGVIYIQFPNPANLSWQQESGFSSWNVYAGDLAVLKATGSYTQAPGASELAAQACGLAGTQATVVIPAPGKVAFYLVTGNNLAGEGGLGVDSAGEPRPNTGICPP